VVVIEKGIESKLQQDVIRIILKGRNGEDSVTYGSLVDGDGLYRVMMDVWQGGVSKSPVVNDGTMSAMESEEILGDDSPARIETRGAANITQDNPPIPNNHLEEIAIDTIIRAPVDKVYNLVYHTPEFINNAYKKDKKLSSEFQFSQTEFLDVIFNLSHPEHSLSLLTLTLRSSWQYIAWNNNPLAHWKAP